MKPIPTPPPLASAGPTRAAATALLPLALLLTAAAAQAGTVSAESVWDSNDARQRAMEQLPRGATVTRSRCQNFEVGGLNTRYRCTLTYSDDTPSEASPGQTSGSGPLP